MSKRAVRKLASNCGWVDYVQWSGPSPQQDASEWQEINYKHDVYGRRSEKKVDGYSTRYLRHRGQPLKYK